MNSAFAAGAVSGKVIVAPYGDATIRLPKTNAAVSIELPVTDKKITVAYAYAAEAGEKPATLSITAPSTDNLVLEVPETTVTLNGATYKEVSAMTADNTLIVAEGATIQKLTVLKGNVEIYGKVVEFVKAAGVASTYTLHITTAERLAELAKEVNTGACNYDIVLLDSDIDLENKAWTPIGSTQYNQFTKIFDGQNHTISNLSINNPYGKNVGLFGFTKTGEVKNLIVNNASVTGDLSVGVVAGSPYTTKYSNIKVTGLVKVTGYSYVGGILGKNAYANLTDLTIDAYKGSFVKADSEAYRTYVGGIIGFMGEGAQVVSNARSNIDVIGSTCDVGGITGIAHYGNSFRNCVCTGNVTLENATDAGDHLEIGGIAGVWHDQTGKTVTFTDCSFTGTLKTALKGVDKSADVATRTASRVANTKKTAQANS